MRQELIDNGYLVVREFLPRAKALRLAKDYQKYAEQNNLSGDEQAPNSLSSYNFVEFAELLCNKSFRVGSLIGENVFPTYTYGRIYKKGSDLKAHKDRDSCEISVTVNLEKHSDWPIYMRRPDGDYSRVELDPGDAVIYLGCDTEHWREELVGESHTQVFLHYVRSKGPRSNFMFDNRKPAIKSVSADLKQHIVYIKDLVPKELRDAIATEYYGSSDWADTSVGKEKIVDKTTRGAMTISLSIPPVIGKNEAVRKDIDQRLFECANKAIITYKQSFPLCEIEQDTGYELLKYETGFGYVQHTDSFHIHPREISCSIALNDDYEGGEFAFFDGQVSYKQEAGSALLFPSNFMFPHQVNKVTNGKRYSIITWFR